MSRSPLLVPAVLLCIKINVDFQCFKPEHAYVKCTTNLLSSRFFFNLSTSLTQLDFLGGFKATPHTHTHTHRCIINMIKVIISSTYQAVSPWQGPVPSLGHCSSLSPFVVLVAAALSSHLEHCLYYHHPLQQPSPSYALEQQSQLKKTRSMRKCTTQT